MIAPVREWPGSPFERADRFVVLQLEEFALIVTQAEVVALEPVLDVQVNTGLTKETTPASLENASGYLTLASGDCPVFALNTELQCLAYVPEPHRICAVMRNRQQTYALSCVAVELLSRSDIAFHSTPRSMLNTRSPIVQLMVHAGKLLLGTTAAAMYSHLVVHNEGDVISFEQRLKRMKS